MDTTDKYIYTIRDDGKVVAFYDEYHYLAATSYRMDIAPILEVKARKIMIETLEQNGYFSDCFDSPSWEYVKTSDIYDLYADVA